MVLGDKHFESYEEIWVLLSKMFCLFWEIILKGRERQRTASKHKKITVIYFEKLQPEQNHSKHWHFVNEI